MIHPGKIDLNEVEEPVAGPGEILLRVKKNGVCGSDIHLWHGLHPFTQYPVVQGHEFSVEVEAVGDRVTKVTHGMKATAATQKVCGVCNPCKRYDEALATLKQNNKPSFFDHRNLAAVYVRLDQLNEARAEVSKLLEKNPHYTLKSLNNQPYKDGNRRERLINDLRKAGVPE
jgi:threonine dehydrogenase-like Zn-dependent dehydrogenase